MEVLNGMKLVWNWYETGMKLVWNTKKNMMTQSFMQIALFYLDKTNWDDFTTSLWRCLFLYVLADEQARGLGWLLEDAGLDA